MTGENTANHPSAKLMDALCARGDLKVWSLLVTLFGDAAMEPGAMLSGPQLSEILGRLQIRPEAQRVALHRLRKEGWITAKRQGRIGVYGLSAQGRRETEAVATQVYAPMVAPAPARYLIIQREGTAPPKQALSLGAGRILSAAPGGSDALSAPLEGSLPSWVATAGLPEMLLRDLHHLHDALGPAPTMPRDPANGTALRLLILHQWRRLALRLPPTAETLLGPDWVGATCRARVATHLAALPRLDPIRSDA